MRFLILLFSLLVAIKVVDGQIIPIPHSHAHNDYLHKRPLQNALENGFTSIEIDVFLHKDKLLVSHVGVALRCRMLPNSYFHCFFLSQQIEGNCYYW